MRQKSWINIIFFVIGFLAIGFGLLTIKSGGFALFGGQAGRDFAGEYIPFVLWFNFISGFVYIISGFGIILRKIWGILMAKVLAIAIIIVFIAFVGTIFSGVEYQIRTVWAMTARSIFWIFTFLLSRKLIPIN